MKVKQRNQPTETAADLTIYCLLDDSTCTRCACKLEQGRFLVMQAEKPMCLRCVRLQHLVFLRSGDTALTRRTKKYSRQAVAVVRYSKSKKRYERQGVMVEQAALAKAKLECAADADQRAVRRERDVVRRVEEDHELEIAMTKAILKMFPSCPREEATRIAAHNAVRGSGRVGRSAAGRALDRTALIAAVRAWIRHQHTIYDQLLRREVPYEAARARTYAETKRVMNVWRTKLRRPPLTPASNPAA